MSTASQPEQQKEASPVESAEVATDAKADASWEGFEKTLTLNTLRDMQQEFANARDWDQFHTPRNLLCALTGEVGELNEIFQWRGDQGCLPGLKSWKPADKHHLGEELSDVLLYLVRLADRCEVDLSTAVLAKIKKNGVKYPADKAFGKSGKYTDYNTSN
jgi:dCTP diphosphatase